MVMSTANPSMATTPSPANTRSRTPAAHSSPANRITRQTMVPKSLYPTSRNTSAATGNSGRASSFHQPIAGPFAASTPAPHSASASLASSDGCSSIGPRYSHRLFLVSPWIGPIRACGMMPSRSSSASSRIDAISSGVPSAR